jgi:DNA-binding NtrC family response regulator
MKTSQRILIVDDEQTICEGCRLTLSDRGHRVDVCTSARAGLTAILTGRYDVVLLDMKLPDMNGMDVLRTLRKEKPGERIVVMTGYSTIENAVAAMKLGACDYITKPFSDDGLVLAVEKAIERGRLVEENLSLRKEPRDLAVWQNIVAKSPKMLQVFEKVKKVASTDSTVLLCGESGTGKELFAQAIHAQSHRSGRQFVAVDCSTLAPNLLESELFGHVKGAFTGAIQDRAGIFGVAHRGTLFLDDVANLDSGTQGKLLRVLEMHEYKPVGASQIKKTDVRVITATNQDLQVMVEEGSFREDLFYRLNVFPIFLPPLRERKEDIPEVAYHFLRIFCRETGKRIDGFTDEAMEMLVDYKWPGNVRELRNVVERLVIMNDNCSLGFVSIFDHLRVARLGEGNPVPTTLSELKAFKKDLLEHRYGEVEKAFVMKALAACEGNVTRAAEEVGMQRPNFHALMRRHHLSSGNARERD